MKRLSEKITEYIVETGAIRKESYVIYQYGFQIGLEMLSCFITSLCIALLLGTFSEFVISITIFMLLRTYAGGLHLNKFSACFICSVTVQTAIMIINKLYELSMIESWILIIVASILIMVVAPVENINHTLDNIERKHYRKITIKLISGIVIFTGLCTLANRSGFVSLITMVLLVVMFSQYVEVVRCKVKEKRQNL